MHSKGPLGPYVHISFHLKYKQDINILALGPSNDLRQAKGKHYVCRQIKSESCFELLISLDMKGRDKGAVRRWEKE